MSPLVPILAVLAHAWKKLCPAQQSLDAHSRAKKTACNYDAKRILRTRPLNLSYTTPTIGNEQHPEMISEHTEMRHLPSTTI